MNSSYFDTFAGVYDGFTKNAQYKKRADYIVKHLKNAGISSGILLDLACGTGTLTAELAKKGYDIIAVDYSEDMLMSAREKLNKTGKDALVLCQDMRELDLYGTVKACVCSLDSINHLTSEKDVQTVFDRVSLFTEPGGMFVFDVNTLYKHQKVLGNNTFVYENGKSFLVWQNELEEDNRTVNIYLDIFTKTSGENYFRDGEEFSEKAYSKSQITKMLKSAGFCNINVFGDMKFVGPDKNEERIYFTAIKK